MKLFFAVLVSAAAVMAAEDQAPAKKASPASSASGKSTTKAAEKATSVPKPITIPEGAVVDLKGDYRYTDSQGRMWIYRKTPFGVTRLEETPEYVASGGGITAYDDGDKVRFERQGPWGVFKWEKKKSELDEGEKTALQNSLAKRQNASKQE